MRFSNPGQALCVAALLLASCATHPGGMRIAQADPLENFNRGVYGFNKGLDHVLIKPGTQVYRAVTPRPAQRGLRNFFNNVDEPFSFINALLQGKPGEAMHTLGRFLVNTILGVGGLADHATDMGLDERPEDIGQTLAVWGVGSGPYLMLPFFGPSTLRDAAGTGAEFFGADPWRDFPKDIGIHKYERYGITAVEAADKRSYLMDTADTLLKGSADEYATVRSAYLQLRQNEIYDGNPPDEDDSDVPPATTTPATAAKAENADIPVPAAQPVPGSLGTPEPANTAPTSPDLPLATAPKAPGVVQMPKPNEPKGPTQ